MRDTIQGYSRGLYANWLWHKPLQLLIDAGEGVQLALGTNVFQPSLVAITHGHSDHILGLTGLAGARRFGKGATTKPWTVLYPEGSVSVEATRDYIATVWRGVDFPITWVPMADGARFELPKQRVLEAFRVTHSGPELTLGYRVTETRRRLRAEFASLPQFEIEALARRQGRGGLMEEFTHVLFVHSGDAMPIDAALTRHADLLVHDATFLSAEERREPIHASTEEALALARDANVRVLLLHHLSIRYDRSTVIERLRAQVAASGFAGDCWWLDEGELTPITG